MGIISSQLKKSDWEFVETFGYQTKLKREKLGLPKTHANDAIAIACGIKITSVLADTPVYYKKHVAHGDYQQRWGLGSEKIYPRGKLFGFRTFDLIQTPKGTGFIKGKRSTGSFSVVKLDGTVVSNSVNVKKGCVRLQARSTTLIQPLK